jgi:hypothetical protein
LANLKTNLKRLSGMQKPKNKGRTMQKIKRYGRISNYKAKTYNRNSKNNEKDSKHTTRENHLTRKTIIEEERKEL